MEVVYTSNWIELVLTITVKLEQMMVGFPTTGYLIRFERDFPHTGLCLI